MITQHPLNTGFTAVMTNPGVFNLLPDALQRCILNSDQSGFMAALTKENESTKHICTTILWMPMDPATAN